MLRMLSLVSVTILLAMLANGTPVGAEESSTPEGVAKAYFADLRDGKLEAMVGRMHPEALQSFKDMIAPVATAAEKEDRWDEVASLFSDFASAQEVRDAPPDKFFLSFFRVTLKMMPQLQRILTDAEMEMLGHVQEGDVVHVVARFRGTVEGVKFSKMSVVSLKKTTDGWGVLLTGEMDGLGQALRSRFL